MIFQSPPFHHLSNQLTYLKISNHGHGHDGHDHYYHYNRYGTCHDGACGFRIHHVPRNLMLRILLLLIKMHMQEISFSW
jgi:hypothetical protein